MKTLTICGLFTIALCNSKCTQHLLHEVTVQQTDASVSVCAYIAFTPQTIEHDG